MVEFIPFYRPEINDEDVEGVIRALKSGWLSKGPKVIEFEESLKEYLNTGHVVSCNSGTAALHLALLSLGIGVEDEVIVPSFTFCSSVNVIMHVGAKPVFVDIDDEDLCLDLHDVKRKITKKTKAIIAVHFAGYPAKLQELQKLCKEHGLFLIEDAAHALGTKYDNTLIGTHGDIICFSFYATKNITTGEGGALVTKNEEIAEKARLYGWHGITKNAWNRYGEKGSWRYDVLLPGFKYNMMDLQASLGISQLKRADEMIEKRKRIAEIYQEELKEIQEYITLPNYVNNPSIKHAWHLFVIKINPNSPISRDQMIQEMKKRNIGLSVHFIPVHMHPYYQERFNVQLPKTEEVFDQIISLPLYSALTENEVEHIITSLKSLYQLKVGR